ncbi:MAG TPA: amidohydrolase [Gemmatimonadales bacterium]|nr:amidohydrolase [Gemmatimonadales bacterium]
MNCLLLAALGAAISACAARPAPTASPAPSKSAPYPSTYQRRSAPPVLIRNATVLTAAGAELTNASVLIVDGKIAGVGTNLTAPPGVVDMDATGKFVTPGLIDVHSHLGVYAAPSTSAEGDGNEATRPVTAEVWAEHSFWPQDPQIPLAVAGGVTVIQALPGSANLIGGRSAVLRLVPARTVQEMKYPGAPYGLKMACGENPKRVYGKTGPSTRMGNMAGYRSAFIEAQRYGEKWEAWNKSKSGTKPDRDLKLETLVGVLRGQILVQNHCYRADEMAQMLDLGREFGFRIRSFHHAAEAYKIADLLAKEQVAASIWSDWWGFKMESLDGIPENAALVQQAGGIAIIHSDSENGIQRLNQDAAKAMYEGRQAGLPVTREQAIRWITRNPAWALGIDSLTGTLEAGKAADVVVWSGDPFSVYSKAERVYNEGSLVYDRNDPKHQWRTDFNLGTGAPGVGR